MRDAGLLESAVAMPRATAGGEFVHEGLFAMAAAYAFHLAQNRPFIDGNKRTGLLAAIVFLDLNGVTIVDPEGKLYDAMSGIAERRLDKALQVHVADLEKTLRDLTATVENLLNQKAARVRLDER